MSRFRAEEKDISEETSTAVGLIQEDSDTTSAAPPKLSSELEPAEEEFVQYGQRWLILLGLVLSCMALGIIQNGFSPIAGIVGVLYNCEPLVVQSQTMIIVAMFVPSNFVVIPYMKKKGLKSTMYLAAITMTVGSWMRLLVWPTEAFWIVSFGTAVAAFGQVCFLNSTSRIATLWFGDRQRALATSIGMLSTPFGGMFGFIIPSLILTEKDLLDVPNGRDKFVGFLFIQNFIATVAAVLVLVFMRTDRPPTPPSKVATMKPKPLSFGMELKKLGGNSNYMILACSYALSCGTITALGAILSSLTGPFGYSARDNSLFGTLFIFLGVTGSLLSGALLDKFQRYKLITLISTCASFVLLAAAFVTLPVGSAALYGVNMALVGLLQVPMSSIGCAFAVELTYPIPEPVSNGIMIMVTKLYGALLIVLAGALAKSFDPLWGIAVFVVNAAISAILSFFIREEFRRLKPHLYQQQ